MRIVVFIFLISFFVLSCKNKSKKTDEFKKSIYYSGIFIKEEKLNLRENRLYLKGENGEIKEFISMPFFGEEEQSHLSKDGKSNVQIIYDEFYNPVIGKVEYRVKVINPVYAPVK